MLAYSSLFWQIRSYYGISRNLLIKFKDDQIDETSILAQVLSSEAAISSLLDMSIRSLPGDHGLPLQQVFFVSCRFKCFGSLDNARNCYPKRLHIIVALVSEK
jgi:hypothetical protein